MTYVPPESGDRLGVPERQATFTRCWMGWIVDLYRHDLPGWYPDTNTAPVVRILNQVPVFVVHPRVIAETDVSSLIGVAEFDPATHIDWPILRVHGEP